ncbi:aminopeptidase N [Shewanella sp. YIC-542]|uniref:aminopeptidase N n=1 Tax=Shewanella mytili TaxID=3377111 RepID=UPI00398F888B
MPLPRLFRSIALAAFSSLLISACSTQSTQIAPRDDSPYLTQAQAQARAARVSDVRYQMNMQLDGSERFSNQTTISFQLTDTERPLTLDISQAHIQRLEINGHLLYPNYNGHYLTLNPKLLQTGSNLINISFSRHHSTNGEGLHRFVDPVDGKVYLYSHFEPAAAQQMFAVFDQPDIKASYQLTVQAPADWQVISAMRESRIEQRDGQRIWHFPASPKLSPYNFSLHAGPYHVWQDDRGPYPMRLFARQSVASQVTPDDWFRYTAAGLDFFERYFRVKYPFQKYDQVLVPEFLYGAMENAAAITFSESRFLYNAKMTQAQQQQLAGVIMHEMAHQWFGDLVTMKWWNGLWLNESFASFMGTLATAHATEFDDTWRRFYASGKQQAYIKDSLVTTHPIEVPVASTANAFDNIDAITYSKGASVLKQLRHLLGNEVFRQGVSDYLHTFAWQNATLDDFINSLSRAAGRDLSQWTKAWLYTAGVNHLQADFQCHNGSISSFTLTQSAATTGQSILREQKVQIALLQQDGQQLSITKVLPVTYQGASTTVTPLLGERCPDLVYPNYDDWGFVKVALDKRSFTTARQQLARVEDPLLRAMLWQSLWDSVMSGHLPLNDYLDTVFINLPQERDYTLTGQILQTLHTSKQWLEQMAPLHTDYRDKAIRALAQMSLRLTMEHTAAPDLQRRWFNAYVDFARDMASMNHLAELLAGHSRLQGITLDQDSRWHIVQQLNRYDYPASKQLLQQEAAKDPSDSGRKAALAAMVSRPEAAIKRDWLNRILHEGAPFPEQRIAMTYLYPAEQQHLSAASAEERLEVLPALDKKQSPVFMRSYAPQLIPAACNHASVNRLQQTIKDNPRLSVTTMRPLQERLQEDRRCVMISENITY